MRLSGWIGIVLNDRRMACDEAAADEFSDTRENQVGEQADIDGIERHQTPGGRVDGDEQFTPAQSPEPERHDAGSHGHGNPSPAACAQAVEEICPIHATEREIEQHSSQCD